jgi:sec-independent protein translocase protein TatC
MPEEISSKKRKKKADAGKEMSFWEHLEELRWHIVRSAAVVLILSVAAFVNREIVFDYVILAPKDSGFITNQLLCKLAEIINVKGLCIDNLSLEIINITMSGQFLIHMYISIAVGLIVGFPYVLWEIWRFVKPALKRKEKKYSGGAVLIMSFLFLIGIFFSYFLIVPLTLNFLGTYQVSDFVENRITLRSYINTVVSLTFAVGLVFELPVLVYFFTRIGLLTPTFMRRNRKYALVIVLIISAIITPADIFSQIMVAVPLYVLYEISILVSKRVYARESELAG